MRRVLAVVCLLSLFGLFLFVLTSTRPLTPGVLRFTFLDVGQGDSVIVQTPSGRIVVIDTGNLGRQNGEDAGQSVVAPALRRMGTNHIDLLFLTHPHADHIGGAKSLLELCDVDLIIDNGQDSASPLVLSYLQKAKERNILYRVA
ncbi:MAG: MBL fold metallo-hydrolase, partial [Chthonomonadaceae bacterium]|nr:MBL fold metallo-hydrolase [Chthonomonadaceae bacterium]